MGSEYVINGAYWRLETEKTMTAQTREILLLDGRAEWLQCLPLQGYLDERKIDINDFAECSSTSLRRGYEAVWEIVGNRLYLIGLLDCVGSPFDPAIVFGDRPLPIPADWFTGRLEISQGEALAYYHMGWGLEYATLLRLYLKQGQVVARRRYDQTRLLRRRFDSFVANNPNWHEILVEDAKRAGGGLGSLGGLTAAGLKALGRPELEAEGLLETWSGGLTDDETAKIAGHLLQHCVRAPGGIVFNGVWASQEPAGEAGTPQS